MFNYNNIDFHIVYSVEEGIYFFYEYIERTRRHIDLFKFYDGLKPHDF